MSKLGRTFFRGLAVLLPIAITFAVLRAVYTWSEETGAAVIRLLGAEEAYRAPMGVLALLVAILALGGLMHLGLWRGLVRMGERLVDRIPLVKTVYGSAKDLVGFLADQGKKEGMRGVVRVDLGEPFGWMLGIQTADESARPQGWPEETKKRVAVYLLMSYQIGGFTLFVPSERVHPLDMSVEEGLRYAMTAGIKSEPQRA